ncbi:hypothetical protein [Actinoalloteichus sp. GBA129-24]|uniref:hypothetical protein n=1 Tax=Actinoalloteichus sp. GBA129-24 TaxID=1612551 RepID=UPI00095042B3|nr:hypothetical protein [Actinoalloteichus sp. GBA129-24]APU20978.1 hypothetical protein UA75_14840 [Actinoalloteichus sp. GBA129-24]APU24227.1 hypothetical protein UA75_31320 [Actinoalloteichus sp. GBA129-24]
MIAGYALFAVFCFLAWLIGRRGRMIIAIVLATVAGVVLSSTTIGPNLLQAASASVNGIAATAVSVWNSIF